VAQRTREIGIRMALGSRRAQVLRLVVGEAATLAAIGVGAGAAVALLLARFVRPLLYETAATDPPTYLAAMVLLAGMAILAAWVPAWRAARANPMSALRGD
jgi:ABC-type antimicrobial peptide transport system permease subunit